MSVNCNSSNSKPYDVSTRRRPKHALPPRYRKHPASIRRAIYLVWVEMHALGLTVSGVAVLQAIIASGVDANNPTSWVFARKKTLADRARVSESTVYRTLLYLENKSLIVRSEQLQRLDGSLCITQVALTTSLVSTLGLNDFQNRTPSTTKEAPLPSSQSGTTEICLDRPASFPPMTDDLQVGLTDDAYIGEQKVDRREEQPRKPSIENQSSANGSTQVGKFRIPTELLWTIHENRLTGTQLCNLMKLARSVPGQKLADYLALRRDRIRQLQTPNDCYLYLRALIASGVDAKHLTALSREREFRESRTQQATIARGHRTLWLKARDGQTYMDPATKTTYTINASIDRLLVGKSGSPSCQMAILRLNGRFVNDVRNGKLIRQLPNESDQVVDAPRQRLLELKAILKGKARENQAAASPPNR